MPNFFQKVFHPEWYHGHGKQPPFFEGWYFKLIDAAEKYRYAVIPGIFLSHDREKHHAFVQVLDGQTGASSYFTYPPEQFVAAEDDFDVRVGPNHFRADCISLNLEGDELALKGELNFSNLSPWPVTMNAPGIMGWYGWVPIMECYHGVVSLDHTINGSLILDGNTLDYEGGRGYIEKDWGQSFPSAWVWMQSNHFGYPGTCLTASVAVIPMMGRKFPGHIIGVWHDKTLYKFAKYTGAIIEKLAVTDEHVTWVVSDNRYRLEIFATRSGGGLLHAPSRTEMHKRVMETLQSKVEIRLSHLTGANAEIFHGTGRNAGLEVQGDLSMLLK
jgi:tocopherol cyclase